MMRNNRYSAIIGMTVIAVGVLFSFCGGGGGGNSSSTPPTPPSSLTVSTDYATLVSANVAILNGKVNPSGQETKAWFEWGTDPSLSTYRFTSQDSIGSGTKSQEFTAKLTGLLDDTTYYCRIVAATSSEVAYGDILPIVTTSDWSYLGPVSANGVTDNQIQEILVDPRDDRLIYAAGIKGLYISRDRGETWVQSYDGDGTTGSLAMDPNNPDRVLYAAGFARTLLLTSDQGITWQELASFPQYIDSIAISALDNQTIYVGAASSSSLFYRSTDNGASWNASSFGYQDYPGMMWRPWDIEEDPNDGTLYVSVELGDHTEPYHPPAFRSQDRGVTWENITDIIPWHGTKIVVDPTTQDVYFLTEGDGLYKSIDHGESWTRYGNASFTNNLIQDPNNPQRFFGGETNYGGRSGGIYVSNDSANTFVFYGLNGKGVGCNGLALSGDSQLLFASCYGSGIYVRSLPQ